MKVVVIGAGVAGLSIGWRLARSGCEVVVLERARPGRGATWAAGGMLAAAAENADDTKPDAQLAARGAVLWPDFARDLESNSGHPVFYRRDGSLIVASSQPEMEALSRRAGNVASMLSPQDARSMEPLLGEGMAGALFAPDDAQVDNRALGLALAVAFTNAGGILQMNEAVVRLEMSGDRILGARTPFALHEGDAFVIAAGAWSGALKGIPPDALPPVVPVKGEMIAFKLASGAHLPTRLI